MAGQTTQSGGNDQLRTHVGERHGGCGGTGVTAVVAGTEGQAESADGASNFDRVVHAQGRFNQRNNRGTGGQFGGGAVDVGGVLCGGEHDASQTLDVLEGFDVLPPLLGGDSVDTNPGNHARVQHADDLFAGGVLLFGRATVLKVNNDGVGLGFEGPLKNVFGGVGANE